MPIPQEWIERGDRRLKRVVYRMFRAHLSREKARIATIGMLNLVDSESERIRKAEGLD